MADGNQVWVYPVSEKRERGGAISVGPASNEGGMNDDEYSYIM